MGLSHSAIARTTAILVDTEGWFLDLAKLVSILKVKIGVLLDHY